MKNLAKIAILGLVILGCERTQSFPPEPFIRLEEYDVVAANVDPDFPGEHVRLKFYFTDGDGDLGLDTNQLSPPHCVGCDHYYNLFVNVNSKEEGTFEKTYEYNARIENLTPNQQNKTLEGHIIYRVDIFNRTSDTVMIDLYLEDRSLNKSNQEFTPELYIDL